MSNSGKLNENEIYKYQKTLSASSKLFISDKSKCRSYDWDRSFCYIGTKSELIAEGLAEYGWFPGDSGNNKTSLKVIFNDSLEVGVVRNDRARMQPGQRCLEITRTGSKDEKFKILDMFPTSIKAELDGAMIKEWESEEEQKKTQEEHERAKFWEQYQLKRLVNNIDEARKDVKFSRFLNGVIQAKIDLGE
jgi:hypothetical protein